LRNRRRLGDAPCGTSRRLDRRRGMAGLTAGGGISILYPSRRLQEGLCAKASLFLQICGGH